MALLHSINHPSRVQDIRFCARVEGSGQLLLVAAEDKKVSIYEMDTGGSQFKVVAELVGHSNR